MKKIGLLCLALVLALGAMGGAVAYFSSTNTVPMTVQAGDMELWISPDGSGWYDDGQYSWTTPDDWAPGDTVCLEMYLKNVGSAGAKIGSLSGTNGVEFNSPGDLADHIFITRIDASETGYANDYMGIPISYWEGVFGASPLTLAAFVASPYSCAFYEGWTLDETMPDWLDGNGTDIEQVIICFEFDPEAENEYMNDKYTFDLVYDITDDWPTITAAPH